MVTYKTIRQNKKFLENPPNNVILKSLSSSERVEEFLKDGKWYSMKAIQLGTHIGSMGNMYNILYIRLKGKIEIGVCDHCDSVTKLHRLK